MAIEAQGWSMDPLTRVFVGVSFGAKSRRLKAALLRCRGEGWQLRCLAVEAVTLPPPEFWDLRLANACGDAIASLTRLCELETSAIDVIGLHGLPPECPKSAVAAALAERTGVTVVSQFEDRDLVLGGKGLPLDPIPDWLLHHSNRLSRLLIHLGQTVRVSLFWANENPTDVMSFDCGPGCAFLDALTVDLSQGKYPFDPSGHFAVQGKCCDDLIAKWKSHPYLLRPPPKFLTSGEFGSSFREASLTFAREKQLSARDVLCSASHFVIDCLAEALHRFRPMTRSLDEVWVTGGGMRNGFLWKMLRERLAPLPVMPTDRIGLPSEAQPAMHAALLAFLALDHLPGNLPALTGARQARVLGHITPGSAENWDRWVCHVADRFDLTSDQAA